jgi:hypothetical protein
MQDNLSSNVLGLEGVIEELPMNADEKKNIKELLQSLPVHYKPKHNHNPQRNNRRPVPNNPQRNPNANNKPQQRQVHFEDDYMEEEQPLYRRPVRQSQPPQRQQQHLDDYQDTATDAYVSKPISFNRIPNIMDEDLDDDSDELRKLEQLRQKKRDRLQSSI